jgi:hypothetical protein
MYKSLFIIILSLIVFCQNNALKGKLIKKNNIQTVKSNLSDIEYLLSNLNTSNQNSSNSSTGYCDCGWPKKEITDTINKITLKLKNAYKTRLLLNKSLNGNMLFEFGFSKTGLIKDLKIISQNTNDTLFNNDIMKILGTVRLREIECSCESLFVIRYPFIFSKN